MYAWGDDDMGKISRIPSENYTVPKVFAVLSGVEISRVFTGLQMCAALSPNGSLFTWYLLRLY